MPGFFQKRGSKPPKEHMLAFFCIFLVTVPCSPRYRNSEETHSVFQPFRFEIMAKGGKGGGYGGGGGGPEGQSKKLCQVFLRNLPLAMLEPVSGGWGLRFWGFGGQTQPRGSAAPPPGCGMLVAVCASYLMFAGLAVVIVAVGL